MADTFIQDVINQLLDAVTGKKWEKPEIIPDVPPPPPLPVKPPGNLTLLEAEQLYYSGPGQYIDCYIMSQGHNRYLVWYGRSLIGNLIQSYTVGQSILLFLGAIKYTVETITWDNFMALVPKSAQVHQVKRWDVDLNVIGIDNSPPPHPDAKFSMMLPDGGESKAWTTDWGIYKKLLRLAGSIPVVGSFMTILADATSGLFMEGGDPLVIEPYDQTLEGTITALSGVKQAGLLPKMDIKEILGMPVNYDAERINANKVCVLDLYIKLYIDNPEGMRARVLPGVMRKLAERRVM